MPYQATYITPTGNPTEDTCGHSHRTEAGALKCGDSVFGKEYQGPVLQVPVKTQGSRANRFAAAMENKDARVLEALRAEMIQWAEGMEGTNLRNTFKYDMVRKAAKDLTTILNALATRKWSRVSDRVVEFPGPYSQKAPDSDEGDDE